MNSLIKQAEENVVNIAKFYDDAFDFLEVLTSFGNKYTHEYIGRPEFFDGITSIRKALCAEQQHALANCFMLSGVGGEEANAYSMEKFKTLFDNENKYGVMHLLDAYGTNPSRYSIEDDRKFRAEARDKIKENE